jgi:hypothetical protein
MNSLNRISLIAAFGFLSFSSTSVLASPPDISGTYICTGSDPFTTNNAFSESLVFTKNGNNYKVKAIPAGDTFPYFLGTAVVNKNIDNAFAGVYWNIKDSSGFGTELFTIKPDGSLNAVFVGYGRDKTGTETCTKAKVSK